MNPGIHSTGSEKDALLAQASRTWEHPPAQILFFHSSPGQRDRFVRVHLLRHGADEMCMAPSPCTGSYFVHTVSPRALVKRPPRHWKAMPSADVESLAVALQVLANPMLVNSRPRAGPCRSCRGHHVPYCPQPHARKGPHSSLRTHRTGPCGH